jgi:Mn2+/Fe2+ NRAMP family transporter
VNGTVNLGKISILNIRCSDGGRYLALVSQNGNNFGMALVFSFYLSTIKLYMLDYGTWRVISMATQS